jgi:SAM-dependent methyltransferase
MPDPSQNRRNLLHLEKEHWRPPVYSGGGALQRLKLVLFRFLDLQSATIWRDLARILPQVTGTVLDVGCGIQPFRRMFSAQVRYVGVDTVDSKAHFGYETPDTLYYSGDTWPVADQTADFILCTETLEHIPDPEVFLKEAFRTLKLGGRALFTVPFAARWHFIPYDYWRYTPSGLGRLLQRAGFTGVEVFARGNQLTVACYKVMALCFALLAPVHTNGLVRIAARLLGLLSLPFLFVTALLANLTLGIDGSVDCLGYTFLAERPPSGDKP